MCSLGTIKLGLLLLLFFVLYPLASSDQVSDIDIPPNLPARYGKNIALYNNNILSE